LLSLVAFYEVGLMGSPVYLRLAPWVNSESLLINWGFMFDSLTVIMCIVVTFVSSLVHLYAIEYMSHDPHLPRFMSYLSLFTFFMLILVTADNYIQMFLGWEGIGLASYLLINFWFTRVQANKAAIKAMIVNRIGDFCLIIAILILYVNFKSVDYSTIASLDTIDFMPLASVNYSGGIIITDWYSGNLNSNEDIKISIRFLSNEIRSDALDIKIFKKMCDYTFTIFITHFFKNLYI
jgi:NADH:ubiquinone oxidoreductase subunit 5 (subunit L)/multisubunit Na+/H+ antiporter MnhA subunit